MDNQPINDLELLQAMDSCRPGYDDLSDPALAGLSAQLAISPDLEERFQRLQKLDATLASVVHDVPVPEGLDTRLLAALAVGRGIDQALEAGPSAAGGQAVVAEPEASKSASIETPAVVAERAADVAVARPARRLRPWLFAAAGVVAAMLLLALGLRNMRSDVYTTAAALDEAIAFFNNDLPEGGELVAQVSPPSAYPPSASLAPMPGLRWRKVSGLLDRPGVAYDMTSRGTRATLYVLRRNVAGLPTEPPATPRHETGNCFASAWEENGLVYVLVVQGDPGAYSEFLDLPRGPVT